MGQEDRFHTQTGLRINQRLDEEIEKAAKDLNVTKSNFIRLALTKFLKDSGYLQGAK